MNQELPWLRWWDSAGNLLPTGEERAEQERQRAERLADRLRGMGIDPDEMILSTSNAIQTRSYQFLQRQNELR